jgi:NAD(P)-dependent dehydrogenase (short-subunit alcohol dehydrogenase family)
MNKDSASNSGSTVGAACTAQAVLAGTDLSDRTVVLTGGYSGIGLAATRALVGAGARVVVPARRPDLAQQALADLDRVEVDEMDLGAPASVRAFAERFRANHGSLDILIANAGVMACPERRVGPGWEAQFAINHLGHYALTALLWPALVAAETSRVVAVSSGYNPDWRIRWEDVHFTRAYDKWAAYTQSKLANILFARHLDRLAGTRGVRAFSVNPGAILTPLQRHLPVSEMVAAGWIDADGHPAGDLFKTPEQGSATSVWAATSPQLEQHGGAYCADCQISQDGPPDDDQAARLWALSAELTGLDLPD